MSLKDKIPARNSCNFLPCFLTAAFMLLTAAQLFGQLETGNISGTVRDTSGAVIPEATVTVKSAATGVERSVQSGSIGQYLIPALTPGIYELTVTNKGFKTFRTSVEVTVGGSATLDAQLEIGESTTVVEVVGGGATAVNTQTQEMSQLVDTQQMAQLPSLTRNYYVNPTDLLYSGPNSSGAYPTTPLGVTEEKGGLGALATGGNHDERRFGQFSLRVKRPKKKKMARTNVE